MYAAMESLYALGQAGLARVDIRRHTDQRYALTTQHIPRIVDGVDRAPRASATIG